MHDYDDSQFFAHFQQQTRNNKIVHVVTHQIRTIKNKDLKYTCISALTHLMMHTIATDMSIDINHDCPY